MHLLLALSLAPSPAHAWEAVGATWPAESIPVQYWVDEDIGFSSTVGDWSDEDVLAAVQAGFEVWAEVECAAGSSQAVSFQYMGRTSDAGFGEQDGRNVVFLIDQGWPDDPSLVTAPSIYQAGPELVEVDIALNLQHFPWTLQFADGVTTYDVQAGVVHEVGHLLGLWHSTVPGASLNPAMDGNPEAISLAEDDIEGLCALYDGTGSGDGAADVGEDCVTANDCLEGLDCLLDGDARYCTQVCAADEDCPADMSCEALAGGEAVCARVLDEGGCGCSGAAGGAGLGLALAGGMLGLIRRRRRRSQNP